MDTLGKKCYGADIDLHLFEGLLVLSKIICVQGNYDAVTALYLKLVFSNGVKVVLVLFNNI